MQKKQALQQNSTKLSLHLDLDETWREEEEDEEKLAFFMAIMLFSAIKVLFFVPKEKKNLFSIFLLLIISI